MGLFGKIFDKKVCDICGEEIKLLGNRKLEDGNLCKNCAAKLSPWFDERRHSTVEQIRQQLDYREQNREAVAAFRTSTTLGKNTKIYLDESAGKFMVTAAKNLEDANPDVLTLSQLTNCDYEIKESRREEKRTVKNTDGSTKQVSFVPPHYTYSYDFYMKLTVNSPYFDEISFKVNSTEVKLKSVGELKVGTTSTGSVQNRTATRTAAGTVRQGASHAVSRTTSADPRMNNQDYVESLNLSKEIKNAMLRAKRMAAAAERRANRSAAAASAAQTAAEQTDSTSERTAAVSAAGPMTCPCCNATTTPDADGCCEYCGAKIR